MKQAPLTSTTAESRRPYQQPTLQRKQQLKDVAAGPIRILTGIL